MGSPSQLEFLTRQRGTTALRVRSAGSAPDGRYAGYRLCQGSLTARGWGGRKPLPWRMRWLLWPRQACVATG